MSEELTILLIKAIEANTEAQKARAVAIVNASQQIKDGLMYFKSRC